MSLNRRSVLAISGSGLFFGSSGCLSQFTEGEGRLTASSSNPDEQTLTIRIAPEYGAESVYTDTIALSEADGRVERDAVVTGRNGDDFFVEVQQETIDENYETVWELSCAGTDDQDDQLNVLVTKWGEVRFSHHQCRSGFDDEPSEDD